MSHSNDAAVCSQIKNSNILLSLFSVVCFMVPSDSDLPALKNCCILPKLTHVPRQVLCQACNYECGVSTHFNLLCNGIHYHVLERHDNQFSRRLLFDSYLGLAVPLLKIGLILDTSLAACLPEGANHDLQYQLNSFYSSDVRTMLEPSWDSTNGLGIV